MIELSAIYALAIWVPCQVPVAIVPTAVICVWEASTLKLCAIPSPVVAPVDVNPDPAVTVPT